MWSTPGSLTCSCLSKSQYKRSNVIQSVCVYDLQTSLAVARVDGQVLELAHVHVDGDIMGSGEGGGTKPLELQSNTLVVVRGKGRAWRVLVLV